MTDEETNVQQEEQFTADDYIKNLTALKETTVSKEEYQRVLSENKRLANALVNGYGVETEQKKEIDVDKLRKELFGDKYKKTTDLEFFTKAEELCQGIIDRGGVDPYLPRNKDYMPTGADVERANRIHSVIRECIEYADGDPQAFTNELQRRCNISRKMR